MEMLHGMDLFGDMVAIIAIGNNRIQNGCHILEKVHGT